MLQENSKGGMLHLSMARGLSLTNLHLAGFGSCFCTVGNDLPGLGNEPEGESPKGSHKGWFSGVIPTHSLSTSK